MTKDNKEVTIKTANIIDSFANIFAQDWNRTYKAPLTSKELKGEADKFVGDWLILSDEERKYFHKCVLSKISTIHYTSETGFKK